MRVHCMFDRGFDWPSEEDEDLMMVDRVSTVLPPNSGGGAAKKPRGSSSIGEHEYFMDLADCLKFLPFQGDFAHFSPVFLHAIVDKYDIIKFL